MSGSQSVRTPDQATTLAETRKPIREQCPAPPKTTPALVIESGCSSELRRQACLLQRRKYRERGLGLERATAPHADEIILLAKYSGRPCGTLTMSAQFQPLQAEEAYADEINNLTEQGRTLIELKRLAIDAPQDAGLVMAALFDHAWHLLHAGPMASAALIEVHPRHASFYRRRFGFAPLAGPRLCPRAAAPGVLLMLSLPAVCVLPRACALPPVSRAAKARHFEMN